MGKYSDKIIHINASKEFMNNPECMAALEELCKRAYYNTKKPKRMERKEVIFQGIGEASMCWSETPKGVFDDKKANEIGERIISLFTEQDETINHLNALVENKNAYIETCERRYAELEIKYKSLVG